MSWLWAFILSTMSAFMAIVLNKIVTDSLPDLSIKNLIKYAKTAIEYSRFFIVLGTLVFLKKIGKIPPRLERELELFYAVIGVILLIALVGKALEQNKIKLKTI